MVDDLSLLQFIEQRGVCDAAVFDDLAHAVREIGIGQRGERFGIGEDEARLMERADEVFTERQIDTRFAPTLASTCAKRDVGTCTKSMPRRNVAAAKHPYRPLRRRRA